jgi:hypothetical protein
MDMHQGHMIAPICLVDLPGTGSHFAGRGSLQLWPEIADTGNRCCVPPPVSVSDQHQDRI